MSLHEEELQKKIESGENPQGDELDVKAYREVFHALNHDRGFELPANFTDRVVAKVMGKRKKDSSRDMWWFGIGIFLIVIAFVVAVVFTGFKMDLGFLRGIADYKGLVIFGIAFIAFLNWLDKKLIHLPRV